jgi:hypothetical protein
MNKFKKLLIFLLTTTFFVTIIPSIGHTFDEVDQINFDDNDDNQEFKKSIQKLEGHLDEIKDINEDENRMKVITDEDLKNAEELKNETPRPKKSQVGENKPEENTQEEDEEIVDLSGNREGYQYDEKAVFKGLKMSDSEKKEILKNLEQFERDTASEK